MIGRRVGNYQITQRLAEGGMGAVYVAEHPGIGRRVAVKVLLPEVAADEEMVRRFFNEARAAHAIRHPGIVEVLDFGTLPEGTSYIVMELLEGENLAARLKRLGRLRLDLALDVAAQAASALGAAHAQGIVHRDLKPDNLFLVADPRVAGHELVKVLDFGIAKLAGGPSGAGSFKTRTGVVMGTPVYMSPEQCLGNREVDHRTDIYALGVILFQMLAGRPPFVSEGHGELIHMHIGVAPPRLREVDSRLPERLERLVARTLAKDPAERPQSMAELEQALALPTTAPWSAPRPVVALGASGPAGVAAGPTGSTVRSTTLSASASFIDREVSKLRRRAWRAPVLVGGLAAAGLAAAVLMTMRAPAKDARVGAPSPPAASAALAPPPPASPPAAPPAPSPTASPTPAAEPTLAAEPARPASGVAAVRQHPEKPARGPSKKPPRARPKPAARAEPVPL